jgi:hypothetical protein
VHNLNSYTVCIIGKQKLFSLNHLLNTDGKDDLIFFMFVATEGVGLDR